MFIGHLPAGYITSRLLFPCFALPSHVYNVFIAAGLLGAIAPDLDLIYFFLVDNRQHHHHTYFTHFPVFWFLLLALSCLWFIQGRKSVGAGMAVIFSLNAFIHMLLDSIVGDIWWLAPFIDKPFSLATVPAIHKPWWVNFLLHWSFGVEIALAACAFVLWNRDCGSPAKPRTPQTSSW